MFLKNTWYVAAWDHEVSRQPLARRPAVSRYYAAMAERPSFTTADIWPSLNPLKLIRQMV